MTYEEIVSYICQKRRFGSLSGREVSEILLKELGNPEKGMRVIHIAGTNGKGSCAAFLAYMLKASSVTCGLFTSPHLISFRERIRVLRPETRGEDPFEGMISSEDVQRLGSIVLEAEERSGVPATMFDLCLAMALLYFKEQKVDTIVLETGMGGRLDSTRALTVIPEVSVITNIGLEHTKYLGDTMEKIAAEKAGILRQGTKAVFGEMHPDAIAYLRDYCRDSQITFSYTDKERTWIEEALSTDPDFTLGLYGSYQLQNAATALCAFKKFAGEVDSAIVKTGLSQARWPGRMQILKDDPFIMVDGAHNPEGSRALSASLVRAFPGEKFTFICAVMADKDHIAILGEMSPLAERFIFMKAQSDRAQQPEKLAESAAMLGCKADCAQTLEEAFKMASQSNEKTVVFGSLYFVAEVLDYLSSF